MAGYNPSEIELVWTHIGTAPPIQEERFALTKYELTSLIALISGVVFDSLIGLTFSPAIIERGNGWMDYRNSYCQSVSVFWVLGGIVAILAALIGLVGLKHNKFKHTLWALGLLSAGLVEVLIFGFKTVCVFLGS